MVGFKDLRSFWSLLFDWFEWNWIWAKQPPEAARLSDRHNKTTKHGDQRRVPMLANLLKWGVMHIRQPAKPAHSIQLHLTLHHSEQLTMDEKPNGLSLDYLSMLIFPLKGQSRTWPLFSTSHVDKWLRSFSNTQQKETRKRCYEDALLI